jgi:putative CocE/NonD family hydrolase
MGAVFKWFGLAIAGLAAIIAMTVLAAGLIHRNRAPELTPAGLPHDSSRYLAMRDGTRIAIDVWLPKDLKPGQQVPVLIKGTPYWRGASLTFLGDALSEFGVPILFGEPDTEILNGHGYAVIVADTRGTGASFGYQKVLFDDAEVRDFGEIIDWASRQSWSNGRVGAYGFSYRGILAVDMASLGRPALKALAPSFDFPDLYLITHPGGVLNETFLRKWGALTGQINRGEPPCEGMCRWLIAGPKRVDEDSSGALVEAAIAEHARNFDVFACSKSAPDRDSKVCTSGKTLSETSELARKSAIERTGLPIYVIAGYFDGPSPAQVMWRFKTFSNPQQVVLGPISHGGFESTDPFAPKSADVDPSYSRQIGGMADFFDRYLKPGGSPITRSVTFKVLNGGGWQTSPVWPPRDAVPTRYYLAADHQLSPSEPTIDGSDTYRVDFGASTGEPSRYQSPVDLSRTRYPDRQQQDRNLLTYTGAPLASEIEIAGDPIAHLNLSTTAQDGEVVVYLEDVRAGSVVYLSEGVLRLSHRKLASPGGPPDQSSDPLHTYLSADEADMVPGRAEDLEISLSPIASVFRKGDRIRVAIAGADAANLARIPSAGTVTLTVERGNTGQSYVELPVEPAR